jgi:hypothetical protein
MSTIDLKTCRLFMADGTSPTPNKVEVHVREGLLTWTEALAREYLLERGILSEVRDGDETPMDVSFNYIWDFVTSDESTGATPKPYEILKNIGAASTWVSSDSDTCRPYAIDLIIEQRVDCGAEFDQRITFPDFRPESIAPAIGDGQIAVTGKCNATAPVYERLTLTD